MNQARKDPPQKPAELRRDVCGSHILVTVPKITSRGAGAREVLHNKDVAGLLSKREKEEREDLLGKRA